MASATFVWHTPPVKMAAEVDRYGRDIERGIEILGNAFAKEITATMKQNADWVDRTRKARDSLEAVSYWNGVELVIVAKIGVPYGSYLVLGTRYMRPHPIIQETLAAYNAPIMRAMRKLVGG